MNTQTRALQLSILFTGLAGCDASSSATPRQPQVDLESALSAFSSSGCKGQPDGQKQCVSFTLDEAGDLTLELENFVASCGFPPDVQDLWKAKGSVDEGLGTVEIFWDFEYPNACGNCVYDWTLKLADVDETLPFTLGIAVRDCDGTDCEPRRYQVDLDLRAGEGKVCPAAWQR